MFWGAAPLMTHFAKERIVAIYGSPGTYKSCLAMDMMIPFLEQGYSLSSSVNTVWSDPEDYPLQDWLKDDPKFAKMALKGVDVLQLARDMGFPEMMPWVYRRCFIMDEGGLDLREFKKFGPLSVFPRKFRCQIAIPSKKLPHEDLTALMVVNLFLFEDYIPGWRRGGGYYYWQFDSGAKRPLNGQFVYIPESIGLFDTDDLAESSNKIINKFIEAIKARQKSYGRDDTANGLSTLESLEETSDMEQQQNITRKLQQLDISIFNQKRR